MAIPKIKEQDIIDALKYIGGNGVEISTDGSMGFFLCRHRVGRG